MYNYNRKFFYHARVNNTLLHDFDTIEFIVSITFLISLSLLLLPASE